MELSGGTDAAAVMSDDAMSSDFAEWFEVSARCGEHPAIEAQAACERCGVFRCGHCLDSHPALCESCALVVSRERLPSIARGVAWKLALAPAFAVLSVAMILARQSGRIADVPASLIVWVVPVICAAVVARRSSAAAAWVGVVSSLALLGWQAWMTAAQSEWMRLADVGMLAIAPLLAIGGASRLADLQARVAVHELALRGD